MSDLVYPAVLRAEPGGLAARCLDFPGLEVRGADPASVLRAAREAVSTRLSELEGAGEGWPEPTSPQAIGPLEAGASLLWIDIPVEDRPVRVTISLGERLLARIDAAAESFALTRSGFLAAAARRQLGAGVSPLEPDLGRKLYEEVAVAGRRIQDTLGPESPFGRTLAELDGVAMDGLRRLAGEVTGAVRRRRAPGEPSPAPDAPGSPQPTRDPPHEG